MVASSIAQVTLRERVNDDTGTEDVVERLVRDHARLVFRVAYSVVRNHHDAEDVAQETFLRAVRQSSRLHEVEDVRAWIGTIAFRIAAERRRQPVAADLDASTDHARALADGSPRADHALEHAEMRQLMWRTVDTLPADLRDALKLSTVQELTSAQAAVILGVPEGTVRNRVHRAKQMLQQKLLARINERRTS